MNSLQDSDILFNELSDTMLSRITILTSLKEVRLKDLDYCLMCVHARWSGYSIEIGKKILQGMDLLSHRNFTILIVDVDSTSPEVQESILGIRSHGYFESVWVENGHVRYKFAEVRTDDQIKMMIDALNSQI